MELKEGAKDTRALQDITAWSTIVDIHPIKALCATTKTKERKRSAVYMYVHTDKCMLECRTFFLHFTLLFKLCVLMAYEENRQNWKSIEDVQTDEVRA